MIDIELLRNEPQKVKEGIQKKGVSTDLVDNLLKLDTLWRQSIFQIEQLRNKQKELSEARHIEEAKENKNLIKEKEAILNSLENDRLIAWKAIPNLPLNDVLIGKSENDNLVTRVVGEPIAKRSKRPFSYR